MVQGSQLRDKWVDRDPLIGVVMKIVMPQADPPVAEKV